MLKYLNLLVVLSFLSIVPLRAQQASSNSGSSIATILSPSSGLQEGYVIITPASGSGSGLVAYEKVGDLQGLTFQTAVLPATTLTTSGAVIVDLNTGANSLTGPFSMDKRHGATLRVACRAELAGASNQGREDGFNENVQNSRDQLRIVGEFQGNASIKFKK